MPKFITETESLLIICIGAAYLVRCSSSAYFALLLPFTLPHSLEYLMPLPLPLPLHHGYHTAREGERVREKWAIESMRNTIQFRIWCTADIHLSIDVMTTWIATAESTVISFVVDFSLHDAQANGPSKKSIEIIFARKLKEAFPATVNDSTYVSIDPRRRRGRKKRAGTIQIAAEKSVLYFRHFWCDRDRRHEINEEKHMIDFYCYSS